MRPHPRSLRARPPLWWAALVAAFLLAGGAFALPKPASAARTASAAPAGFAYRCGVHFCLDGKPFYFAGANTYDLFTFGSGSGDTETQYMDKARIDAHMADLQADNVQVLRTWMFSHESWHGFETAKGVYNEQEFAQFDYVLKSAADHGIKVVPVFENYWEAYGGIDTRLQWEGLSGGHPGRAAFFDKTRCPGCFTSYKNYVSHALNRTNHYTGVKYKDDPNVFAWELMNEPRYQDQSADENVNGTTLRKWVDEMGAFVKGIDPDHMLGAGIEGHGTRYGFGGDEGNPFIYIHQSPYVDYTTAHPYPTESWANLGLDATKVLIRKWIADSHDTVGKPFYMSEFNVHNVDRTVWWDAIFKDFEAAGGDGTGFWWYQDHEVDGKFGVSKGDPELAVFRAHADRQAAKNQER
ncbi:beta-mannosidase [Actinomadura darangshiensis]|uniref:mannan endo-1,4-beta-mannosidase n=1 Tax=Actinomadura darangshiensis TaxID=705336 RepID=A0A4R5B3J4_9ACTN|nr:cellulase family glycosylhydrolase [Actinomadura darangshiensis]TDD77682.1 beta-mannosidase [Actinomadura darangshiensis]